MHAMSVLHFIILLTYSRHHILLSKKHACLAIYCDSFLIWGPVVSTFPVGHIMPDGISPESAFSMLRLKSMLIISLIVK